MKLSAQELEDEQYMERVKAIVTEVRHLRQLHRVPVKQTLQMMLRSDLPDDCQRLIAYLANVEIVDGVAER